MSRRIFVTGGTGFIGRPLVEALRERGDEVVVLSRSESRAAAVLGPGVEVVEGDPRYGGSWQEALAGCDAVINLAGQSVAGQRWNARYKQLLHDSRVETTSRLVEGIGKLEQRPAVLLSASGVDYYPFDVDLSHVLPVDEDDDVDERVPSGSTFLARLCRNWEKEARAAEEFGVRVVLMRTGVALGQDDDGPLAKMTTPFKLFVGGRIGDGKQWFSWLHRADAVRAYLFALDKEEVRGALNLVAPNPVRAGEFARELGQALGRPSWMPVPGLALKLAVGEFAEHLLHGRRAVPAALLEYGFEFDFPEVGAALADVFR